MTRASHSKTDNFDDKVRTLIDAVVDYAIYRISPDGIVESWNQGAERIKGYTPDEIIGQSFKLFYTEADQQAGQPEHTLRTAAETGRFEDEAWRVRKDGTRFRAHVVVDPIRDGQGRLVGFAKITRDVSERYQLEQTREQLIQAQKLEIVGQMTGGLSHDFNNLLTAILGCLDLIAQISRDERVERLIESGTNAAVRGQKLISQLLAFSRKQTLWPQPSMANDVIATLQPLLDRAGGDAVRVRIDLDPAVGLVDIDQAQFQSAILNLVLNARDAMPRGGRLIVRSRRMTLAAGRNSNGAARPAGDYLAVEIEDSGTGMTPEVLEHAIEPFFTTKEVGQGSGLGLSQVHGFAIQSGGDLEIDSRVGKGTLVRLLLPVVARESESADTPARHVRRAVLVVEDNPDVLRVTVEMLRARDYEVFTAEDAAQALSILQRETPIDVLFTDIVMPGMTGVDLARRAVSLRPNLSVLLTSGYARDALRTRHGVGDEIAFLTKPYRLSTLDNALNQLLSTTKV